MNKTKLIIMGISSLFLILVSFPAKAEEARMCTMEYNPVCGKDYKTYGNSCMAQDAGVLYKGECKDEVSSGAKICLDKGGEIESLQGESRSYSLCTLGDEKVYELSMLASGTCQVKTCDVKCLRYDPVCGTDGKTYGCGQADASCNGVKVAYDGECRANLSDKEKACLRSDNQGRFLCAMLTEKDAFEKYLKENISRLSPTPATLGGSFQVQSIIWQADRKALVQYEDGHISLTAATQLIPDRDKKGIGVKYFQIINK